MSVALFCIHWHARSYSSQAEMVESDITSPGVHVIPCGTENSVREMVVASSPS